MHPDIRSCRDWPVCRLHPLPYQSTPLACFAAIHDATGAILLDSGRPQASRGRFDILSAWPLQSLEVAALNHAQEKVPVEKPSARPGQAFFSRLRKALSSLGPARLPEGSELPFATGLLGYLSYDFGKTLEPAVVVEKSAVAKPAESYQNENAHESVYGRTASSGGTLPLARFGLYDWALITDHARCTSQLVFHPACPEKRQLDLIRRFEAVAVRDADYAGNTGNDGKAGKNSAMDAATDTINPSFTLTTPFSPVIRREDYQFAISQIQDYIRRGDCYQVNYTQPFRAYYEGDPWAAYGVLRTACATPYAGYINLGDDNAILSLSPERFLRLSQRQIEARPIKGTRPRGATENEDQRLAKELCNSEKDRAENVMIVDLLRNDIGRTSRIGSVRVPELCSLESYPNVHHLVSCVRAELAPGLDAFDLLAGSFPGGSITGAPKIRAMQIIGALEPESRSIYCGSMLYIDVRGEMDSSITIRTLLAWDGELTCWGGGGIVMDSAWEAEYQESLDKVNVLMRALEARRPANDGF